MIGLNETIKEILTQMQHIAQTNTVVGEPVKMGDKVIIPVTKVSLGFGAGGGSSKQESDNFVGGSGGGINIEPVGFIVSDKDGAQLLLVNQKGTQFGKVLDLVPSLIEKVAKLKGGSEKKEGKGEKTKK